MKCKVFKIHLQNEFDEVKLNKFLAGVTLKQVFASIVAEENGFWSILAFYEEGNNPLTEKTEGFGNFAPKPIKTALPRSDVEAEKAPTEPITLTPEQDSKYIALRKWRNERAAQDGLAPYMIAHNDSLMQIAMLDVKTPEDLLQIKGFGEKRAQKYGEEILKVLETPDNKPV